MRRVRRRRDGRRRARDHRRRRGRRRATARLEAALRAAPGRARSNISAGCLIPSLSDAAGFVHSTESLRDAGNDFRLLIGDERAIQYDLANIDVGPPFKWLLFEGGIYSRFIKNSAIANDKILRVFTTSNGMGEAIPLQDWLQGGSLFVAGMIGVAPPEQPLTLHTMHHQLDMGIQEMQRIAHATISRNPPAPRTALGLQLGRCKATIAAMKALAGDKAALEMIVTGGYGGEEPPDGGEERRKLVRCR